MRVVCRYCSTLRHITTRQTAKHHCVCRCDCPYRANVKFYRAIVLIPGGNRLKDEHHV